jgi:hypothetical protein
VTRRRAGGPLLERTEARDRRAEALDRERLLDQLVREVVLGRGQEVARPREEDDRHLRVLVGKPPR